MNHKKGLLALSPLIVFVTLYLVTSIIAGDFYKVPITVAFMISSIFAVIVSGKFPLTKRIDIFSHGAGASKIMLMIWIFVLAGAFANTAKMMGSIDATVNITLSMLPASMLLPGLFIAACFVSISVGTSVGTIIALSPIAAGIAHSTGSSVPLLTAVVVGGSLFGDNLSFISDTTIAATSTQGCKQSDKFYVNSYIALPAVAIILIIYIIIGRNTTAPAMIPEVEYIKIIPYVIVLATAVSGINVTIILTAGIILSGIIGIYCGAFDIWGWLNAMGNGISGMGELIVITMMASGMLELIKANGGIDYIISGMTRRIKNKREAELSIAALVSIVNICTANNTVAIITIGGIAKQIGDKFKVDSRKCASILDTMSCCIQGMIPYGAQLLMAAGLVGISPVSIVPYLYYPFTIGAMTILAITFRYPKKFS